MGYIAKSESEQVVEMLGQLAGFNKDKCVRIEPSMSPDGKQYSIVFVPKQAGRPSLVLHSISFELMLTVRDLENTMQRIIDRWHAGEHIGDNDRNVVYQVVKERFSDECPKNSRNPFAQAMPTFINYFYLNFSKYGEIFGAVMRAFRYMSTTSTLRVLNPKGRMYQTYFGVPHDILNGDAKNINQYLAEMQNNMIYVEGCNSVFGLHNFDSMPVVDGVRPTRFMHRLMRVTGLSLWDVAFVTKLNELHKQLHGAVPFLFIADAAKSVEDDSYLKHQVQEFIRLESQRMTDVVKTRYSKETESATTADADVENVSSVSDDQSEPTKPLLDIIMEENEKSKKAEKEEVPVVPVSVREIDIAELRASMLALK